jgi:hypothetical protein
VTTFKGSHLFLATERQHLSSTPFLTWPDTSTNPILQTGWADMQMMNVDFGQVS